MNDEQTIRDTITSWLQATKEGDLETLAGLLDDNVLFVVPSRPPFGKKEFLAGNRGKPHHFKATAEVREVEVNGNWALSRVQLEVEITVSPGGKTLRLIGPTMSVWRKAATGRWLIWRDANMVAPVE